MFSDVITDKGSAKKEIQGALFGLLLILGAYIILNTINPQLVTGKPNFKAVPERPDLIKRPSVTATNAFGTSQSSAETALGTQSPVGSCVKKATPIKEQNSTLYSIDTTSCPNGSDATALGQFTTNCRTLNGVRSPGTTFGLLSCRVPDAGSTAGRDLANGIGNTTIDFTNGAQIGSQYITRTNGTTVTTNLAAACENIVKDITSNKATQYANCLRGGNRQIESRCLADYGKYNGSNVSSIVCTLPKEVVSISTLTKAFEAYKAADPSRKFDTFSDLSVGEEKTVCQNFAKGVYFDIVGTDNKCAFY